MLEQNKLSLWMAILVNISVMFGVGIFINTVTLAKRTGGLGFLSYLFIAFLMTPLIISLAKLISYYPSGGFYSFAAHTLSPLTGFISSWSYFIGKLASASLIIDVFTQLIKTIIPALTIIPTLAIDITILVFFTIMNMFNIRTNMFIIYTFIILKFIPIIFAILGSIFLWHQWSLPEETLYWSQIPSVIPFVIFAFVGFEVACSISRTIKNPEQNAPKSIIYAFGLVICITTLYQLFFFLPLGKTLMDQQNYLGAFPALLKLIFPHQETLAHIITHVLHICTAAAALGGSYGILFSNHWNLYTLAEHKHTFFHKLLTKLNKHHVPAFCIIIEALVCAGYLFLTHGNQFLLQQVSVLGCVISFTLSIISLLKLQSSIKNNRNNKFLAYCALGSCIIFMVTCIKNLLTDGPLGLLVYSILILLGILMFYLCHKKYNYKST